MNRTPARASRFIARILLLVALGFGPACATGLNAATPAAVTERITYQGWKEAIRLHNQQVESVVVPEVGRVMVFRFLDGENVFWEDSSLAGKRGDPSGKEWVNFGGDKSWPSPEAEWKNYTQHKSWMPPAGFDGLPATARIENETVVITSPVDPFYGIRTVRRVTLQRDSPTMTIETIYERVSGQPARVGIWVITQLKEPVAVYVPIPSNSTFTQGHFVFRDAPWPQLTVNDGLLRVTRDPAASHKLGSDADRMLWVGESVMCLVSSPRLAGAEYPDRGASAEVYTNPNPKKYVELETLGPLATLKPGDRISQTNTYTLRRRGSAAPAVEARAALER